MADVMADRYPPMMTQPQRGALTDWAMKETIMSLYKTRDLGESSAGKSSAGWVFTNQGGAISWQSKIQASVTALSSTEAEYVAATSAAHEGTWLRKLQLCATGVSPPTLTINGDNQAAPSAWNQEKLPLLSSCLRHMETRFHFLKEQSKKKGIPLN
eukprot:gene15123-biopygen24186